jgi:hypothetical protein
MRRVVKQDIFRVHRPETMGLGVMVLLGGLIPLLGSILLTSAVVGAVLLYRQLQEVTLVTVSRQPPSERPPEHEYPQGGQAHG